MLDLIERIQSETRKLFLCIKYPVLLYTF
jgi:hypothetical protein